MNIRKAAAKDGKGIAKVLMTSYNIKSEKECISVFREEVKKGHHYIVAEENKKILGIVTWLSHGLPKHMLAELDRIALLPEHRGKGVSRHLKEAMISDAQKWFRSKGHKLRKLYLLTHEDNERARKFYEKMGFEHETTLKDHYYKGKHECVYSMFFDVL
jgi:ribosomal protein S18 acetylase RimI-like enzyme